MNFKEQYDSLIDNSREFHNVERIVELMGKSSICMSWGCEGFILFGKKILSFKVNGHHHKGLVFICVNFYDLFDIYYTDYQGEVIDQQSNIFLSDLIDTIDKRVEYLETYKF